MKLIVFGPTGGTGHQLVEQAFEQGHEVTAFARNPEKLRLQHEKLEVVQGDVFDTSSVLQAVKGHDAALCLLGTPPFNKKMVRAIGTRNIVHALEKSGIKRFLCQSSFGVGDSRDLLPFHYKYLIAPLMLRAVFKDHEIQEEYIKASELDWTIVRPAVLTNNSRTGTYVHGFTEPNKTLTFKISREDVAEFMLKQLMDDTYLKKSPSVSC
ncbi:MAG: SDR family oxidoreductase [Deferribacteres bacterium]|nr:SDR family oxidoreductase [candidate division KSB1 bacterium]MCB9503945.1 SDR family oxidoreductase [Deferribacteres bacterium]